MSVLRAVEARQRLQVYQTLVLAIHVNGFRKPKVPVPGLNSMHQTLEHRKRAAQDRVLK